MYYYNYYYRCCNVTVNMQCSRRLQLMQFSFQSWPAVC